MVFLVQGKTSSTVTVSRAEEKISPTSPTPVPVAWALLDKILEEAGKKGVILSGLSAGAICWFEYGNSDSRKFGSKKSTKLVKVRGTGFLPYMACPHYDVEKSRRPSLKRMIQENGGLSIALENCSALEVVDDQYRIITSSKNAHAYKLYRHNGKVVEEELPNDKKFRPLEELFIR